MKKLGLFLFLFLSFFVVRVNLVQATSYLTVSPTSGSYGVDDTFTVILGVDSGGETIGGIDGVGTYSSSYLELTSIEQADDMVFEDVEGGGACTIKDEDAGKFSFACYANQSYGDQSVSGALVKLTFKAISVGTASLSYNCTTGSTSDSNIVGLSSITDVISCGSNQSGSYTISEGSSSSTTSTLIPTSTSDSTTSSELPQTGSIETTIVLVTIGLVSLLSAIFLRIV